MSCIGWGVSRGEKGADSPDEPAPGEPSSRGGTTWAATAAAIEAAYGIADGGDAQLEALAERLGVDGWRCRHDDPAGEVGFASAVMAEAGAPKATFVAHTLCDGARFSLEVFRTDRSRHSGPVDETRILAVAPHLARAARLRLHGANGRTRELAALVAALPVPAFVLDGCARVLLRNEVATALLRTGPLLRVANGTLRAGTPADTGMLLARITKVACGSRDAPAEALVLRGFSEAPVRLALSPLVSPLGSGPSDLGAARVLALVMDPATARPLDRALVETLYELTPTEAALACGLVEGQTVHDLARDRSLSLHTVRTHLKRILDKTGTHRQAALVRLLAVVACASPPLVCDEPDPATHAPPQKQARLTSSSS